MSRINPQLFAYTQLLGSFDYNKIPITPICTNLFIHEKNEIRQSWAPHAVKGWYVGPVMQHYMCYKV